MRIELVEEEVEENNEEDKLELVEDVVETLEENGYEEDVYEYLDEEENVGDHALIQLDATEYRSHNFFFQDKQG
jgi:hypothetical protein